MSALFTEETINDKVLRKLKMSKYNKDIEFENVFHSNIDYLEEEKNSIPIKTTFTEKNMILKGLSFIALMILFDYYMLTLEI